MWWLLGKAVALLLFFILAHRQVPSFIEASGWNGGVIGFFLIWLTAVLFTVLAALHPKWGVRLAVASVLTLSAGNALSYLYITGFPLNAIEVERLFQDIGFLDETLEFYGGFILKAVSIVALLFIGIVLPVPTSFGHWPRWRHWSPLLLLLPVTGVGAVVYFDGGGDSDALPVNVSPLGFVGVLIADEISQARIPERLAPPPPATQTALDKIVVVMDESVRGDWLDINTANGIPTGLVPYLHTGVNFGLGASFANCSAASNLSFRYAARRDSFLIDIKTRPSLWAFAKKAGYKTVYLDGQRTNRELQNFMTAQELSEIDELIQHNDETIARDKDIVLVEKLRALLQRPERLFIYVNKNGVHFPYEGKYPPEATIFTPHMQGKGINVNEGNQYGDGFGNEAFRNSYRNAVAWNTGEFFKRLLPTVSLDSTLLLFTSDHGQNFTKTQATGFLTHCTTGPAPAPEGTVPIVALTGEAEWLQRLRTAVEYQSPVSHWNLPPTLLLAMGYAPDFVASEYEPSLFERERGKAEFVSTFFVRFGLEPVWNQPVQKPVPLAP